MFLAIGSAKMVAEFVRTHFYAAIQELQSIDTVIV